MNAIDTPRAHRPGGRPADLRRVPGPATIFLALAALTAVVFVMAPPPAFAGRAALGEAIFYPCTSCHPVTLAPDGRPTKALPNAFKGHRIVLESHDKLGKGTAACLVCHDDPARDPGKLKLVDGSLVDVTGDVSAVCYRCHSAKYNEWKAGTHGKRQPKCTSAGCHDPHTPSYIYATPLPPFVGTGFQTRAVSQRVAFTPLAGAPLPPPTTTPSWLAIAAGLGVLVSAGLVGTMTMGRLER